MGADANYNNDRGDEMSDIVGPSKTFHSQLKQQLTSGRSIDWKVELKRFYLSINMPNKVSTILDTSRPEISEHLYFGFVGG